VAKKLVSKNHSRSDKHRKLKRTTSASAVPRLPLEGRAYNSAQKIVQLVTASS